LGKIFKSFLILMEPELHDALLKYAAYHSKPKKRVTMNKVVNDAIKDRLGWDKD